MKKSQYALLLCVSLMTIFAGWNLFSSSSSLQINAQGRCRMPAIDPFGVRWTGGTTVTVKIHSAFTENEREAIRGSFYRGTM